MRAAAAALFSVLLVAAGSGQKLVDARSAIERIEGSDPEAKIERAEAAFAVDLRAFPVRSAKMSAKETAALWLALVDEAVAIPRRSIMGMLGGSPPVPIGTLYTACLDLPPPETWPEIRALVDQRPPSVDRTALQMLCARLTGDDEAVLRLCDEFDREQPKPEGLVGYFIWTGSIRVAALRRLGRLTGKDGILKCLGLYGMNSSELPCLTDLLPAGDARQVVLEGLKQNKAEAFVRSRPNRRLAQQVVLAHLKEFPKPVWTLAQVADDLPYVQRLIDHYGLSAMRDPEANAVSAAQVYVRGMLLAGKADQAAKVYDIASNGLRVDPEDWGDVPKNLDQTVLALQKRLPNRDMRDLYLSAAIACGHIPEAIHRLRAEANSAATPRQTKLRLLSDLVDLHARVGDLRGVAADCRAAEAAKGRSNDGVDPAYGLLRMGLASGDPELTRLGIAHSLSGREGYSDSYLSSMLLRQKRYAELQRFAVEDLREASDNPGYQAMVATALCQIYYLTNRPRDILTLLREFPSWPANDLASIDSDNPFGYNEDERSEDPSTGFYAAWALAKTGQRGLAVRVLRNDLLHHPNSAKSLELLNGLDGASALPVYEELKVAHSLSGTPVLWKAALMLKLGRIGEAEASIRQALAMNPVGSFTYRQKLYSLWGEILANKGDRKGARLCGSRVVAIGLASQGQDLMEAGLFSQATAVLGKAAALWPDDAVMQAQFGACLDKQCRHAEAHAHRLLAIRNLPASLGENCDLPPGILGFEPVERLLGAFDALVRSHPGSAMAYFARGSANQDADRSKEAVADFEKAVAIDPNDYLAWGRLSALTCYGLATPAQVQRFAFGEMRIAPLAWMRADFDGVSNVAALYKDLSARLDRFPLQDEGPLFPLHAAVSPWRPIRLPSFDPLRKANRFVGDLFHNSGDIGTIVGLYHNSGDPFE
ncbi:MAG TPA: hypothetical protein VHE55_08460 [Fimbriimonadaceae bacterium]|nr:hypothetical protein [Fimbriimonadaceae bacterium]